MATRFRLGEAESRALLARVLCLTR
jgi:hypothetical protein